MCSYASSFQGRFRQYGAHWAGQRNTGQDAAATATASAVAKSCLAHNRERQTEEDHEPALTYTTEKLPFWPTSAAARMLARLRPESGYTSDTGHDAVVSHSQKNAGCRACPTVSLLLSARHNGKDEESTRYGGGATPHP